MSNVGGSIDNLRRLEQEQQNLVLRAKLEHIKLSLAGTLRPFNSSEKVAEFNQQFEQIRYRFLVLEGKSKTGKTFFTKWMLGDPSRVYETNCAACPEPELRDFKALYHQVILFDEAAPEMVIAQKKLFQAPPCFVEMGCRATNCHSYNVMVSGIRLVICSNGWNEAVAGMKSQADKDWLEDNSIVVDVKGEPMYA